MSEHQEKARESLFLFRRRDDEPRARTVYQALHLLPLAIRGPAFDALDSIIDELGWPDDIDEQEGLPDVFDD